MKTLLKQIFSESDAWSHSNLKPLYCEYIPPHSRWGVRVNDKLFERLMRERATIGPAEIQQRQFEWMVKFKSNPKNTTVSPN